jgi:protein-S-isoprenylcysteine O-methyltransferase Ste14
VAAMASTPLRRRAWDIPPLWFALAIALMVALHGLVPIARLVAGPWRLAGVLPILAGLALAIWGERRFKRAGTAVRPFEPSSALVEDGPFRLTRNPMYLGLLLVLAGLWILLGTLGPLLVPPAFFWLLQARFVVHEEAHMERHFGARYLDYRRRVRRWL